MRSGFVPAGLKSDRSAQMKKDEEEQQQLGEEEEEEAQTGASTPPGDQEMKTAEVMEVTAEPVHQGELSSPELRCSHPM